MDLVEKTKNLNRHPWEMSRAKNIIKILDEQPKDITIADVGSGDQYFSKILTEFTDFNVIAVDKEYEKDQSIDPRIKCYSNIESIKDNSIDYLFLMDVLEHIQDDFDFLKNLCSKLKIGGRIIITVPAWQSLFSKHDVYLKHFRRYNIRQLSKLVSKANLTIEKSHYFYTLLIPPRILSLLLEKTIRRNNSNDQEGIGLWKFNSKNLITKTIYKILNCDFLFNQALNRIKIRIPGLSLLAVVVREQ